MVTRHASGLTADKLPGICSLSLPWKKLSQCVSNPSLNGMAGGACESTDCRSSPAPRASDSAGLGCARLTCLSNKFSGDQHQREPLS